MMNFDEKLFRARLIGEGARARDGGFPFSASPGLNPPDMGSVGSHDRSSRRVSGDTIR
jgi:hypothetical protein